MKKIGIILLLTAIIIQGFSQEESAKIQDETKQGTASETDKNTKVIIGKDLLSVEDSDSALKVRVGNRGLNMLESLEGTKFEVEKFQDDDDWNQDDWNQDDGENDNARRRNRFKGHWAGIEFGFNNLLTADNSSVMPDDINYMTFHSGKSNNFNINFSQLSLGFTNHFGIVTGLGINWNNYRFDGNNNIKKGTNGIIEILDPGTELDKSKLKTVYLTLPVMLEIQIPVDNHHLNIGAGFISAVKLGSHSKMKFEQGDKAKSNDDFSLNLLRYGTTARIGYQNFQIYGTYYMTPMFKPGKGPGGYDLYPFEIGAAFTFND